MQMDCSYPLSSTANGASHLIKVTYGQTLLAWALISTAQTMGLSVRVCECVYGNDIAVKPDLQSPLSPAY